MEEKHVGNESVAVSPVDPDAEFGGYMERQRLERKLVMKLDLRMSIMVVIYILNYVSRLLSIISNRILY